MAPDLQALQTFVAVVDRGSFALAARELAISPSVASRRVAALERELRTRLLHRTTRGMSLTEAGRRFHERCRALLTELGAACDEAAGATDGAAGEVRITAPQSLAAALVAPVVSALLERHPALRFDVALDERKVDLVGGGVEVAVRVGPLAETRHIARRLTTLRGRMLASPAYLAKHGTPARPAELAVHRALDHSELGPRGLWALEDAAPPLPAVRANSFELLLRLALAGRGIAVLPPYMAVAEERAGALRPVLPRWQSPPFDLYAVLPPTPRVPPRTRLVLDALAAYCERPPETWGAALD